MPSSASTRAGLIRAAAFLAFWQMLWGANLDALLPGVAAALAATWTSLRLLPPGARKPRPAAWLRLLLRFPRQAVVAGVDVAWRVFDPKLPLRPGFVACPLRLPRGPACDTFSTLTSLLPGSVPTGTDENGALLIHCLDVGQPVAAQLAREEALLMRALGYERADG
jgi:multicomponent Na+:H+ antiporter subunit E